MHGLNPACILHESLHAGPASFGGCLFTCVKQVLPWKSTRSLSPLTGVSSRPTWLEKKTRYDTPSQGTFEYEKLGAGLEPS